MPHNAFFLPPSISNLSLCIHPPRLQSVISMATTVSPSSVTPLGLVTILSESKRIINAHSRHFLALSVLFLLPLCFSVTVYPTVYALLSQSSTPNPKTLLSSTSFFLLHHQDPSPNLPNTISLYVAFSLFVFLFALLAVGSITYSVLHGFFGRPVKLLSAVKSAFFSFLPLLVTIMFVQIIISLILVVSGFSFFLVFKGIELVGFPVQFTSPYVIGITSIVLVFLLMYLQINWGLVSVIVVVESSWGLEPLKRSRSLMKGMERVALSILLFFGFLVGILLFISSVSGVTLGIGTSDVGKSCAFILQIVVNSTLLMLFLLYSVAANTVLYMYCKAVHGELAWEIAEEFAREYVSLPFDDGKVPHLVSIVAYT